MIYNSCMQVLAPLYGIYMYLPNSFYHQYAIKMPSIWTISALFQMAPHRQPRLNLSKPNLGTARGVLASLSQVAEPSLGDAMGKRKTWGNKLGKKYGKHTLMIQSHWSLQIAKKGVRVWICWIAVGFLRFFPDPQGLQQAFLWPCSIRTAFEVMFLRYAEIK